MAAAKPQQLLQSHTRTHTVTHLEVNFNVLYIVWACQICKEIRTHLNMLQKIEKTKAVQAAQAAQAVADSSRAAHVVGRSSVVPQ